MESPSTSARPYPQPSQSYSRGAIVATLFPTRAQAETLRSQVAQDDDSWTYLVEPAEFYHIPGKFMVGCYDELGHFVGHM